MTTTITAPIEIENILEAICYAGASYTYPHYLDWEELTIEGQPACKITIENLAGHPESAIFTEQSLATTITDIITRRLPRSTDIVTALMRDDFDAELADVIIQYTILDDIVWG